MRNAKVSRMTGIAFLMALSAILQVIAMFVKFGPFSITLSLIPIVVAAIIYGPSGGGFVGLAMGVVTLFDAAAFMAYSPVATVIVCLVKATAAGVVAGFIFKALRNKNFVLAVILASISAPIVNTGLFAAGCGIIFMPIIKSFQEASVGAGAFESGKTAAYFLFIGVIGFSFVLEFAINSILSPVVVRIIRIFNKNFGKGSVQQK